MCSQQEHGQAAAHGVAVSDALVSISCTEGEHDRVSTTGSDCCRVGGTPTHEQPTRHLVGMQCLAIHQSTRIRRCCGRTARCCCTRLCWNGPCCQLWVRSPMQSRLDMCLCGKPCRGVSYAQPSTLCTRSHTIRAVCCLEPRHASACRVCVAGAVATTAIGAVCSSRRARLKQHQQQQRQRRRQRLRRHRAT